MHSTDESTQREVYQRDADCTVKVHKEVSHVTEHWLAGWPQASDDPRPLMITLMMRARECASSPGYNV
jgi:hypothetical protein